MTQHTTYICDNCKQPVADTPSGKIFGAISASFSGSNTQRSTGADFCSLLCLQAWINRRLPDLIG